MSTILKELVLLNLSLIGTFLFLFILIKIALYIEDKKNEKYRNIFLGVMIFLLTQAVAIGLILE